MALVLDLVRHGHAAASSPAGDADRPLTHAGVTAVRALARRMPAGPAGPPRVFASPLLRARQTAEALVREAGFTAMIELMPELAPEADAADVLIALAAHGMTEGHALLIGHMPLLGHLAAVLAEAPSSFEPAQLVRIELADGLRAGGGTVALTLDPRG
jgi:phosphohistidine phosphatase